MEYHVTLAVLKLNCVDQAGLKLDFFFLKHNRDLLRKNEKELPRVRGQGAKREDYLALLSLSA